MFRLVVLAGRKMPVLLTQPLTPGFLRFRQSEGFLVKHDGRIGRSGHFVDEEIIVAPWYVVQGRETFVGKEQSFLIGKVPAHAHIRHTCKRKRKILQSRMEGLKTDQL